MTKLERSRAKKLEDNICLLNGRLNICTANLTVTAVLILITDVLLFIPMTKDDELYVVLILHAAFLTMLSNLFVSVGDAAIGNKTFIKDMGNQTFIGSSVLGKFLCTMPYEARDVSNMRLIRWEKHMILNAVMTSALMLALEIFGKLGYTEYDGIVGAAVLMGLSAHVLALPFCCIIKNWYLSMFLSIYLCMTPVLLLAGASDADGETSAEFASAFSERLGGFGILSGVSGVLILAALTAVCIAAAEFFCGKMKKTSWNIKV